MKPPPYVVDWSASGSLTRRPQKGSLRMSPGQSNLVNKNVITVLLCFQITSFVSWCGGLPAPEAADNPLRYKFR